MDTPEFQSNPYQPSGLTSSPVAGQRPRRTGLVLICIFTIVLGGFGLLGALAGMVGLVFGSAMQKSIAAQTQQQIGDASPWEDTDEESTPAPAFAPLPGQQEEAPPEDTPFPGVEFPDMEEAPASGSPDDFFDAQMQMQQKIQAVNDRYFVFNMGFSLVHLVVAGMLLAGGIMTLAYDARGFKLLITALATAIVFELVRAVFTTIVQVEMWGVMSESMSSMMELSDEEQVGQFVAKMMNVTMYVGIAFLVFWVAVKLFFYGFSIRHVKRLKVLESAEG